MSRVHEAANRDRAADEAYRRVREALGYPVGGGFLFIPWKVEKAAQAAANEARANADNGMDF